MGKKYKPNIITFCAIVLFLSFILASVPQIHAAGPTYHSGGDITSDETWYEADSPHIITDNVIVQGSGSGLATLTIEAGCEIRFNTDKYLDIGAVSGGQGALYAVGTSGSPITFTSNASSPAPGDWSSIRFWDTTSDVGTILDYCTIQYGGGGGYGNIYCWRSKPTIQNCTISNSGKSGIECNNNSSPTIQNCTISNNALNGYKCGSTGYNYKAKPPAKRV